MFSGSCTCSFTYLFIPLLNCFVCLFILSFIFSFFHLFVPIFCWKIATFSNNIEILAIYVDILFFCFLHHLQAYVISSFLLFISLSLLPSFLSTVLPSFSFISFVFCLSIGLFFCRSLDDHWTMAHHLAGNKQKKAVLSKLLFLWKVLVRLLQYALICCCFCLFVFCLFD